MSAITRQFAAQSANWQADLQIGFAKVGQHFGQQSRRQRALDYVIGLLSPIARKTNWQLLEAVNRQMPICWTGPSGMPIRCVMTCETM